MPDQITYSTDQKKAVEFTAGVMELIAGPGSGKTFVTTHRILHLISKAGVSPEKILVITFTKSAAIEMQNRFFALTWPNRPPVSFGTFHAVFYQILKSDSKYRGLTPIKENEKYRYIGQALKESGISYDLELKKQCLEYISKRKNLLSENEKKECSFLPSSVLDRILESYRELLIEFQKLDFDDMILLSLLMLKENEKVRAYWQNRFEYILIDEFQDISPLQYEIIKILAHPQNNLFVVGDDDQSIYGFRGASPRIMDTLMEDYPNAVRQFLSTNYRSAKSIVDVASLVIGDNVMRVPKKISAVHESGDLPVVATYRKDHPELELVMSIIEAEIREGTAKEQIALLFRRNSSLSLMATMLLEADIDVCRKERCENPYRSETFEDLLAYMRLGAGGRDRNDFIRIMNKPVRYIRRNIIPENISYENVIAAYRGNDTMQNTIKKLFRDLQRIERFSPDMAYRYILNVIGYRNYLKSELSGDGFDECIKKLELFESVCLDAKSLAEVEMLVKEKADCFEGAFEEERGTNGIRLMTYHGSKGLEFDTVILPGLMEGLVPPRTARIAEEVEEERRMFYVAITRAKKKLYLMVPGEKDDIPSRFLYGLLAQKDHYRELE